MRGGALRSLAAVLLVAASVAAAAGARADDRAAVRVAYQGGEGCPVASAFTAELMARTTRVRTAGADEAAREVRVEVQATGVESSGRLVVDGGGVREVKGATCAEVVSALALITALAFDPDAQTGPVKPAPEGGPPGPAPAVTAPTAAPAKAAPPAPRRTAPPDIARPAPPSEPLRWSVGLDLVMRAGVAPRPLFGGGPSLTMRVPGSPGFIARASFDYATTGTFDEGPGGAVFTAATGSLMGCVPVLEVGRVLFVAPCAEVGAGVLDGRGLARGQIVEGKEAQIGWLAGGLSGLARLELARRAALELRGGPSFPWVRHTFVFEVPPPETVPVHEIPAVTWVAGAGVGLIFW
jgi:hypothetical protein